MEKEHKETKRAFGYFRVATKEQLMSDQERKYDVLKKARDLKDEGYHMAVSIKEKSTGFLGNASLSEDDVWVRLSNDEFFVSMEEFSRDFEITAITMDDGEITKEFDPEAFISESSFEDAPVILQGQEY